MKFKTCLLCRHFRVDSPTPAYSDDTPGDSERWYCNFVPAGRYPGKTPLDAVHTGEAP